MPKLNRPDADFPGFMQEILSVRKSAVTVAVEAETTGWELAFHEHQKDQLMLSLRGVATCEAEGSLWLVPPHSAIFVPAGVRHRVAVTGRIKGYAVFLRKARKRDRVPTNCSMVRVNPLLRELIVRSSCFAADYPRDGTESRIVSLMLDEIAAAPVGGVHLPMPSSPKLRNIFSALLLHPAERGTIQQWARREGLGERSLSRMMLAETGISFGRWRQQIHILLSLQWMAAGATVQQVAFDLGYESAGSFITMFRKALGTSPARYMAQRDDSL